LITLKISLDIIFHLLCSFVLGVNVYGKKWYLSIRTTIMERGFRMVGQAIYNSLVDEIFTIKLSRQIEVDGRCRLDSYV